MQKPMNKSDLRGFTFDLVGFLTWGVFTFLFADVLSVIKSYLKNVEGRNEISNQNSHRTLAVHDQLRRHNSSRCLNFVWI